MLRDEDMGTAKKKQMSRRQFLTKSLFFSSSLLVFSPKIPFPSKTCQKGPTGENPSISGSAPKELIWEPSYLELHKRGELTKRVKELQAIYENCRLCPRDCRVNRTEGQKGKCQATSGLRVSSVNPHFGEENPLVGDQGSGTIFFSHCGLRCVYCQNYSISIEGEGVDITDRRLAASMLALQKMGCHNVNLVTPTHYVPSIVNALEIAIPQGLKIPLVYNTSGYERPEILQLLDGVVDIYLPDCKYMDPELAAKYSDNAYNYPYYAKRALLEMNRQVGTLKTYMGVAVRGLMIRHLVLPQRISGSEEFLKFLAAEFPKDTYLNIMGQYRPEHRAAEFPKLARRLKRSEYKEALKWAKKFGITRLAR
jgi:putative pyruvate formate lyase activating enzyme